MKKWIWGLLILILSIIAIIVVYIFSASEERPEGIEGPLAKKMTQSIYKAVNKEAWDSLAYVGWSFRDAHTYLWDKQSNLVEVQWDTYRVLLDPETQKGIAYLNQREVKGSQAEELITHAFNMYCNDGFWFHAFTKLNDPGTNREVVTKEEKALLVTYSSGGVTPGDAYLWYTDSTGLPYKFEIWASILPVKGMDFTWENWDTLYNGARYAKDHNSDVLSVPITNVISGPDLTSIGRDERLFDPLLESE